MHAMYVGRVGALAVALGVGTAILGFTAVAGADTGSSAAGDESSQGGDAGPATAKTRGGSRRGAQVPSSNPSTEATGPTAARRSGGLRSGSTVSGTSRNSGLSPVVPQSPADLIGALLTPGGMTGLAQDAMVSLIETIVSAVPADGLAPEVAFAPAIAADLQAGSLAASEAPVMIAQPDALSVSPAGSVDALGGGSGGGDPLAAPLAWAAMAVTQKEGEGDAAAVAPAAAVTTGEPEATLAVTANGVLNPDVPDGDCKDASVCLGLYSARAQIQNQIAKSMEKTFGDAVGPAGQCFGSRCPASVANTIAAYSFNIVYSLMGGFNNDVVGGSVAALFQQPNVLTFISQTVAGNPALAGLPFDAKTAIGNAAATFVLYSFGNPEVANEFAPFLKALNLPTTKDPALAFTKAITDEGTYAAILSSGTGSNFRAISPGDMRTDLIVFFGNHTVEEDLGVALTTSIDVLLGLATPSPPWVSSTWKWTPPAQAPNAIANFLGWQAALKLLGDGSLSVPGLSDTISTALATLFSSIGGEVASQAGNALVNLLEQPAVPPILATDTVNGFVKFLGGDPPFEPVALLPALAPFVATPVDQFLTNVLSDKNVQAALVTFINTVVPGMLANTGVQELLSAKVATLFGDTPLGQAVGAQAGAAVVALVTNPVVSTELLKVVDTAVNGFFTATGVVPAVATLAGQLVAADWANDPNQAQQAIATFKNTPAIKEFVTSTLGGAVGTLLKNNDVLKVLNNTAASFVNGLLTNADVRAAISTTVAADVSKLLGGKAFGQAVGAQVGSAVASLLAEQPVQQAVAKLVDTELGDFFKAPGVVDAFVAAADQFVTATLAGDADPGKAAVAELRKSTAVQKEVGTIVATSVANLLSDPNLWSAGDAAAERLVSGLLASPEVQQGVTDDIEKAAGDTEFQQAVAAQVAATVVSLMKNPNVSAGLVGVVDTVFKDFFGTQDVVVTIAGAAGELAAAAVAGDEKAQQQAILNQLRANEAIQKGVKKAVGDAVTTLLTTDNFVGALNDALATLGSNLLGDPAVQAGLKTDIASAVSKLLNGGALGDAVGTQVGTAVVEILSNPVVKDALEGLVDTELGEFFRSDGVVAAFSSAADTFALDLIGGKSVTTAANDAVTQLRTNTAVDTAVQTIVTATVANLLGNTEVWQAVDGTASRLMADLLADSEVQNAVADKVYLAVWNAFNQTFLGVAVGDQAAAAVVSLMQNPAFSVALVGLVDTMSVDFFGYPGVAQAFSVAAGELASAAVQGPEQFKAMSAQVKAELRANPDVEQAAGKAVGDAVETLLTDPDALAALDQTAADLMNDLLTDPTVEATLNAQIAVDVSKFLGGGELGESVGQQVGTAVVNFLTDPNVRAALVGLVDTELGDFFRSPSVVAAFAEAATTFTVEVVTGDDVKTSLDQAAAWLRANPAVEDAFQGIVSDSVGNVLSNANVINVFDNDLGALLTDLGPYAGQIVTVLVTKSLGSSPIATPVGDALGAAVQQLLTVPGFGSGVVAIITSILPEFLGQFGVPSAVGGIVGQFAWDVLAYGDPQAAAKAAVAAFEASPAIDSAAKETVAQTLPLVDLYLLSNPAIQQALGSTITTLITTLAADPAIQAYVAGGNAPLAELLANTAVVGEVAVAVGSTVTQLLGYPGFTPALLGAVNQYADDVIDGTTEATAQSDALKAWRSQPAVVGAVKYVVPPQVNSLLADPDVVAALGLYADEETVASLQKNRFNIRFLDNMIGQVVNGTVESLLIKQAGVILADNLAVNLVLGMPWSDWRGFTAQEIIADPFLQIAFGMSLGQGVGSLFGDNAVAQLIGVAVGVPAAVAVVGGSLIAGLLQWLFGRPTYAVTPAAAAANARASYHVRVDMYATNTVVLSPALAAS